MGVAFVPLYIQYLGIEAYGLIGIFATLLAIFGLFDMGMTPALSREMARFTGGVQSIQSIRDLLRSIEFIVIPASIVLACVIWVGSGWLATDWLQTEILQVAVVARSFIIMGALCALRLVESIYRSSIIGLQRQVLFNILNSATATLRAVGAIAVLAWVSPTIEAFFLWQGIVSLISVGVLASTTYRILPMADRHGRFSRCELLGIGGFAGGMFGITLLSLLLLQLDKVLLSKLLMLSEYGYYMLASVVSGAVYILVGPICQAWLPRMNELLARGDQVMLVETYHRGAQFVAVLMGAAAIVLIVFSEMVLLLWTRDIELSRRASTLVSLLTFGNLLNGLMWIPYQTQLAHGWTSLTVRTNIVAVTLIVPALLWVAPRYGANGAAWVWVALNAGYLLIGVHFMYKKILKAEKWRWYCQDILFPIVGAALTANLFRWMVPSVVSATGQIAVLTLAAVLTLTTALMMVPPLRRELQVLVAKHLAWK